MKLKGFFLIVISLVFFSCGSSLKISMDKKELALRNLPAYPQCRFFVISDTHSYDPKLGTEGVAFQAYMDQDRKLLKESVPILTEAVTMMKNEEADFVLVCGDLTKDGEITSHVLFREKMLEIEKSGKKVYIVPGNHDLENPHAVSFKEANMDPVKSMAAADFADFYQELGYKEALFKDEASLSYVAEPLDGLWLLMLDSADYENNFKENYPKTDGRIRQKQLNWIQQMLEKALEQNKAVMAVLHHGILQHYSKQEKFYGEYLVDECEKLSEFLALYGVRLVYTGHYHAQDISMQRYTDNRFIYDIETGSLVTWPCPLRLIEIDGQNSLKAQSRKVLKIDSVGEDKFQDYARQFVWDGIYGIAIDTMVNDYNCPKEDALKIAPYVANAFVAHYQGDESPKEGQPLISKEGIRHLMPRIIINVQGPLVTSLWQDLEPADDNIRINLETGKWEKTE